MVFTLLSQKAVEKDFIKDYDDIMQITNYLINSDYDDVWIHRTDNIDTEYSNKWGTVIINDSQFIITIKKLFKKGYVKISKDKNFIKICRSSSIHDANGVVYSIDGSEPNFLYLKKLEQLSKTDWYYYYESK